MTGRKQSMGSMERLSPTERGNYLASQCLLDQKDFETGVDELGGEKGKAKGHLSLQGEDKAGALFLMRAAAGSTVKKEGGVGLVGDGRGRGVHDVHNGGKEGGEEEDQHNVLLCAPPHSAAKAVFDQINLQVLLMFNAEARKVKNLKLEPELIYKHFLPRWEAPANVAMVERLKTVIQITMKINKPSTTTPSRYFSPGWLTTR